MIEFDTQIIPTARAMSFLFSGRVQLSKCAKNFTLPAYLRGFRPLAWYGNADAKDALEISLLRVFSYGLSCKHSDLPQSASSNGNGSC